MDPSTSVRCGITNVGPSHKPQTSFTKKKKKIKTLSVIKNGISLFFIRFFLLFLLSNFSNNYRV